MGRAGKGFPAALLVLLCVMCQHAGSSSKKDEAVGGPSGGLECKDPKDAAAAALARLLAVDVDELVASAHRNAATLAKIAQVGGRLAEEAEAAVAALAAESSKAGSDTEAAETSANVDHTLGNKGAARSNKGRETKKNPTKQTKNKKGGKKKSSKGQRKGGARGRRSTRLEPTATKAAGQEAQFQAHLEREGYGYEKGRASASRAFSATSSGSGHGQRRHLRPSDLPPLRVFRAWGRANKTFTLPTVDGRAPWEQVVAEGSVPWPLSSGPEETSRFKVLPSLMTRDEVYKVRTLLDKQTRTSRSLDPFGEDGDGKVEFDSEPDTVDQQPSHEIHVFQDGGTREGKSVEPGHPDWEPAVRAARRPLRQALQAIMQPILDERIIPFVRQLFPEYCDGTSADPERKACRPCTSLVRRYLPHERRTHTVHQDGPALVTVVVSLADVDAEYDGGLYVTNGLPGYHNASSLYTLKQSAASNKGERQTVPLKRGDAIMHQSDLKHGVEVLGEDSVRWSWIMWFRDTDKCDVMVEKGWFNKCADAGSPHCQYMAGWRANLQPHMTGE